MTKNLTSTYYLLDGDMRIHKSSNIGKNIAKSSRQKRKIINHIYLNGASSRWPLKTVPYIFDANIRNLDFILDSV